MADTFSKASTPREIYLNRHNFTILSVLYVHSVPTYNNKTAAEN